jgi:hypothetical protein
MVQDIGLSKEYLPCIKKRVKQAHGKKNTPLQDGKVSSTVVNNILIGKKTGRENIAYLDQ